MTKLDAIIQIVAAANTRLDAAHIEINEARIRDAAARESDDCGVLPEGAAAANKKRPFEGRFPYSFHTDRVWPIKNSLSR